MRIGGGLLILLMVFSTSAQAYCRDPGRAPTGPGSYSKPRVPACLEYSRSNGADDCSAHDLDRYRRELDNYIRELNEYSQEMRRFAEEVDRYTQCEIQELRSNRRW